MAKFGEVMRGLMVFIQDIRACKSKEAEMKRINKELANIRSKFKNEKMDGYQKKKYVCKILFIFLLGIDVDFGYQEAVNLLSSLRYSEKQIGYLFVSVIFDEGHNLMPLVIQAVRLDLQSSNPVFKTLGMQCVANIGSKDMVAQIGPEIPSMLTGTHATHQVKQTACLCLVKLMRVDPKVINHLEYASRFIQLLNDKHLGVVTAACSLIIEGSRIDQAAYRNSVSVAVQRLQRLVTTAAGELQDYAYYFIPAPWLSVLLLRLIQMFTPPTDDAHYKGRLLESVDAILNRSQEPSKSKKVQHSNAKNAVLFEAINVIIHIESEPQLQVRACNQLGSFLSAKETNLRYLSLEHLSYLATSEFSHEAVKKHQDTVIAQLKNERDVSVRLRAVDLLYAMCDHSNAVTIVNELVNYLKKKADYSIREELVLKIAILAEKFAPDSSWYVDTMLSLIRSAGDYVSDEVWHRVIQVIINREDVQGYAAKTVYEALQAPACHENMIKVGAYVLGEYGNLIAGDSRSSPLVQLRLLHSTYHLVSTSTRQLLLTTYMKFVNLFPEVKPQILEILKQDAQFKSGDAEIQQRAVEYLKLATVASGDLLAQILEEMPAFPEKDSFLLAKLKKKDPKQAKIHANRLGIVYDAEEAGTEPGLPSNNVAKSSPASTRTTPPSKEANKPAAASEPPSYSETLLDIFGGGPSEQAATTMVDGFGSVSVVDQDEMTPGWETGYNVFLFKNSGILFENDMVQIGVKSTFKGALGRVCVFYGNKCSSPLRGFSVDVFDLDHSDVGVQMDTPATILESGAQIEQKFNIECKGVFTQSPKIRIKFNRDGAPVCLVLRLPVRLNKFFEPLTMDAADFFQRWKQLGDKPEQEAQLIFDAKNPFDKDVSTTKLTGFGLSVLSDIDPNVDNFVSGGIITGTTTRIGCLLRLEPNRDINKYRLTIRSSNAAASKHFLDAIHNEF